MTRLDFDFSIRTIIRIVTQWQPPCGRAAPVERCPASAYNLLKNSRISGESQLVGPTTLRRITPCRSMMYDSGQTDVPYMRPLSDQDPGQSENSRSAVG